MKRTGILNATPHLALAIPLALALLMAGIGTPFALADDTISMAGASADGIAAAGSEGGVGASCDECAPVQLTAQAGNIASGTSGTCTWVIDSNYTLIVRPTTGTEGTLDSSSRPWDEYVRMITSCRFEGTVHAVTCYGMFWGCCYLASLDLSGLDTSSVRNMSYLFYGCSSLESVNLAGLDTSSVANMCYMFYGCSSLESVNLTGLDTSSVVATAGMFSGCSSLTSLDLSGLDTSSVTNTNSMFSGCYSLASFKVGGGYVTSTPQLDLKNPLEYHYDAIPGATASNGRWFSAKDKRWYTREQIVESRAGVADTYTSTCPAGYGASISEATVSLSKTSYTYTGKAKKPAVTVRYNNAKLALGADYTLSFSGNVNAGTATVTITGKGCWQGNVKRTFKIKKAANTLRAKAVGRTARAARTEKRSVTLSKPVKVTKAKGKVTYKVATWTTKRAKKYLKVSSKSGKVTLKKGTPKGTYKFKVKVTAKGSANYKSATKTVSCKVVVK